MDSKHVLSEHTCTICMRILHEPVSLFCGHNYCQLCLIQLLRQMDSCPLCRSDISGFDIETASVNVSLQREIQSAYPDLVSKRQQEHQEDCEVESNKYIRKLTFGNDCRKVGERGDTEWFEWTFYVTMTEAAEDDDLFIREIVVNLHPTFKPPRLVFKRAPFEITRTGWGTFEIDFTVYFTEQSGKLPMDLTWHLSFRDGGRQKTIDLEFDKRNLDWYFNQ
eukprot:TRINITY_DN12561_c0_g1_i1.p1 TRINITY_DN12561_c0_g1~~TRINITY_DN12561_c0_g1_i1.p1  ORF type:complete len:221 (-),score=38.82 TRINITY_DN12561_c0_g1_i1:17-679(-)